MKTQTFTAATQSCSLLYRSHIYDAVELHSQKVKTSSTTYYEYPLVSSSSEMPSTAKSSQDVKADTVELQDNPSYVAIYK